MLVIPLMLSIIPVLLPVAMDIFLEGLVHSKSLKIASLLVYIKFILCPRHSHMLVLNAFATVFLQYYTGLLTGFVAAIISCPKKFY